MIPIVSALVIGSCSGGSDDAPDGDVESSGTSSPEVLLEFGAEAVPGDVVGLIAVETDDGTRTAEWADRLDGTIRRLDIDDADADPEVVASIPVVTQGEQRGLLGQVDVDGRRFAAWTQPDTFDIVVGEVVDGAAGPIVWNGGVSGSGAIGGVLDEIDGQILLGLGRNTAWDSDTDDGGALLVIDPDGEESREADVLSVGYTNPWAFTVTSSGDVWFADNAAGPDPDDPDVDDIERIGRGDLIDDRNDVPRISDPGRAATSMIELPDGRLGICGFLDNELVAYDIVSPADGGDATELELGDTIMPCITGAAIFADGTIVTAAQSESGETLQILRP